jgi:hypothetical protein
MATAAIGAAVIGVAGSAAIAAGQAASTAVQAARGNLKGSIQVVNGTEYALVPAHAEFRRGATFFGIEGEFYTSPNIIDPRKIDVFSFQQVQGATTDVVGCVVYRCAVFDLLIGWHIFDQGGIQHYLMSGLFPPKITDSYFTEVGDGINEKRWNMRLVQTLNAFIWSGKPNDYTSRGVALGMALKVKGKFDRGVIVKDANNNAVVDSYGNPNITHKEVSSDGNELIFSTSSTGGGTHMQVFVHDYPTLYQGEITNTNRVRLVEIK